MLQYSQQLNCELRSVPLPQQTQGRREKAGEDGNIQAFVWGQKQGKNFGETTYLCNNIHILKNSLKNYFLLFFNITALFPQ